MIQPWLNPATCTSEPHELYPHVIDFCNALVSGAIPVYLSVEGGPADIVGDCVSNVRRHIAAGGGNAVLGWSIWEWHGVMIEGEFHMVWGDPNGALHDVTPKPTPMARILFLPDQKVQYDEQQINNVRRPLIEDERLAEFIGVADKEYEIMNRGERANQHGAIEFSREEYMELQRLQLRKALIMERILMNEPGRNDLCRCGSGRKWKRCHGQ
jgi:hypothetical protein